MTKPYAEWVGDIAAVYKELGEAREQRDVAEQRVHDLERKMHELNAAFERQRESEILAAAA